MALCIIRGHALARANYHEAMALVVGAGVQPLLDLGHTARRHAVALTRSCQLSAR